MRPRFAFLLSLFICASPSPGLDVAGVIVNKSGQPIPSASVCLKSNPARCVESDAEGNFHITDVVGLGFSLPEARITLELTSGRMILTVPAAAHARIDWHDAAGRALAPPRAARLAAGRNALDMPKPGGGGLRFIRVSTAGFAATWKAVLLEPAGEGRTSPAPYRQSLSALSKASALSTELVVTKAEYRTEIFRPASEVAKDVVITLIALSDSGFKFTSVFKSRNISLDRAKGEWITESRADTCQGTTGVSALVRDTSRFAVRDGRLLQWLAGQCVGEAYAGGGTDVVGSWTLSESDVFLPEDLRPSSCTDTIPSSTVPETVKGILAISEAEQTLEFTVEACPADMYLPLIEQFLMPDTTIGLTTNTCRRLVFRNAAGEEGVIDFEKRGDSLASTFTHTTSICRGVEMMRQGEGVALDCSGNDPAFTFLDCLAGTGFFGDVPPGTINPLAKSGSGPVPAFHGSPKPLLPMKAIRPAAGRSFIFSRHGRNHSRPRR